MTELTLIEFQNIQTKLLQAYWDFTGKEVFLDKLKKSYNHPVVNEIITSIKEELEKVKGFDKKKELNKSGEIMSFGTIAKLLFTESEFFIENKTLNFQPGLYAKIERYIHLSTQIESKNIFKEQFRGSYLLDIEFRKRLQADNRPFEDIHFYTLNLNRNIQWKGISKELDIERPILLDLKNVVYQAFNYKNCKICAVVLGKMGAGKSTVLRRLSWDLIESKDFRILWVNDMSNFTNELEDIKHNRKRYLIIVDNWPNIEKNPESMSRFLTEITDIENVRVIISDSNPEKRDYRIHVYGGNYFYIVNDDNFEILEKLAKQIKGWDALTARIAYLDKAFFKAPLQLILLVVARMDLADNDNRKIDKSDFSAQIIRLVTDSLSEIYTMWRGLALTLYYWAQISSKCLLPMRPQTLLTLAIHFSGEETLPFQYDEQEKWQEWLLYFVNIKNLIIPERKHISFASFCHDSIIEALIEIEDSRFRFSEKIMFEFLEALISIGDTAVATDLYLEIKDSNKYITDDFIISFSDNLRPFSTSSFRILVGLHAFLINVYAHFDELSEEELEYRLLFIISLFYEEELGTKEIDCFFSTLIECGCKAPIVLELFQGTGEYALRMIEYEHKKGKTYFTKLNFYKELGRYLDNVPRQESSRWLALRSSELLAQCRHLTKDVEYGTKE